MGDRGNRSSSATDTTTRPSQVNDTYDTLEYLGNQSWSNGEVFVTGVSADAIDATMTISHPHPSLRAQLLVFSSSQAWETFYPGGAYREALIDNWLEKTVKTQAGALIPFVHSQEDPALDWWYTVNGTTFFQNVVWPTIHWAGWYDIFLSGHLAAWRGFQSRSSLPGQAKIVVDTCGHCQDAAEYFPENAILGRAALPLLMALDLLADDSVTNRTWPAVAEGVKDVTFYVMGADEGTGVPGGYWTTLDDFPTPVPTRFYLGADGSLATTAPTGAAAGFRSYTYDPRDPVPSIGGNNLEIKCGPLNQAPLEKRADVLLFTSDVLTEPLAVTGALDATIFVSTNVVDTDVVVKLIDVYPSPDPRDPLLAGDSLLVQDGISRLKWRNWRTDLSEALLSGSPADTYSTTVSLWNTSYIVSQRAQRLCTPCTLCPNPTRTTVPLPEQFAPGHRIRVHVTSSNWPRFFPNPNTGNSFDKSNVTAATTIHCDGAAASSFFTLPVVQLSQLPEFPVEEAIDAAAARHDGAWQRLVGAGGGAGAESLAAWLRARGEAAIGSARARMRK